MLSLCPALAHLFISPPRRIVTPLSLGLIHARRRQNKIKAAKKRLEASRRAVAQVYEEQSMATKSVMAVARGSSVPVDVPDLDTNLRPTLDTSLSRCSLSTTRSTRSTRSTRNTRHSRARARTRARRSSLRGVHSTRSRMSRSHSRTRTRSRSLSRSHTRDGSPEGFATGYRRVRGVSSSQDPTDAFSLGAAATTATTTTTTTTTTSGGRGDAGRGRDGGGRDRRGSTTSVPPPPLRPLSAVSRAARPRRRSMEDVRGWTKRASKDSSTSTSTSNSNNNSNSNSGTANGTDNGTGTGTGNARRRNSWVAEEATNDDDVVAAAPGTAARSLTVDVSAPRNGHHEHGHAAPSSSALAFGSCRLPSPKKRPSSEPDASPTHVARARRSHTTSLRQAGLVSQRPRQHQRPATAPHPAITRCTATGTTTPTGTTATTSTAGAFTPPPGVSNSAMRIGAGVATTHAGAGATAGAGAGAGADTNTDTPPFSSAASRRATRPPPRLVTLPPKTAFTIFEDQGAQHTPEAAIMRRRRVPPTPFTPLPPTPPTPDAFSGALNPAVTKLRSVFLNTLAASGIDQSGLHKTLEKTDDLQLR